MKKLLVFLSTLAICATSCNNDTQEIIGTVVAMTTAVNGNLRADWGDTYVITNTITGVTIVEGGRYMISAYVMKKIEDAKYEIQVSGIAKAVSNDILVESEIQDPKAVGQDPVRSVEFWAGASWLNLRMQFIYITGEGHTFGLSIDDKKSNTDTLYFNVRHNANGDTLSEETAESTTFYAGSIYGSFNFDKYLPKDKKSVVLAICSEWYKNNGISYIPQTEPVVDYITYTM